MFQQIVNIDSKIALQWLKKRSLFSPNVLHFCDSLLFKQDCQLTPLQILKYMEIVVKQLKILVIIKREYLCKY